MNDDTMKHAHIEYVQMSASSGSVQSHAMLEAIAFACTHDVQVRLKHNDNTFEIDPATIRSYINEKWKLGN